MRNATPGNWKGYLALLCALNYFTLCCLASDRYQVPGTPTCPDTRKIEKEGARYVVLSNHSNHLQEHKLHG
uniref:Putative secreted protein n=1 Tax=Anopheles darlingi TaxID=43151 RepID=A0A2M4DGC1_ANODA